MPRDSASSPSFTASDKKVRDTPALLREEPPPEAFQDFACTAVPNRKHRNQDPSAILNMALKQETHHAELGRIR